MIIIIIIIIINQKPLCPTRPRDYNYKKNKNVGPDLYEKQKEIKSSSLRHLKAKIKINKEISIKRW